MEQRTAGTNVADRDAVPLDGRGLGLDKINARSPEARVPIGAADVGDIDNEAAGGRALGVGHVERTERAVADSPSGVVGVGGDGDKNIVGLIVVVDDVIESGGGGGGHGGGRHEGNGSGSGGESDEGLHCRRVRCAYLICFVVVDSQAIVDMLKICGSRG